MIFKLPSNSTHSGILGIYNSMSFSWCKNSTGRMQTPWKKILLIPMQTSAIFKVISIKTPWVRNCIEEKQRQRSPGIPEEWGAVILIQEVRMLSPLSEIMENLQRIILGTCGSAERRILKSSKCTKSCLDWELKEHSHLSLSFKRVTSMERVPNLLHLARHYPRIKICKPRASRNKFTPQIYPLFLRSPSPRCPYPQNPAGIPNVQWG